MHNACATLIHLAKRHIGLWPQVSGQGPLGHEGGQVKRAAGGVGVQGQGQQLMEILHKEGGWQAR